MFENHARRPFYSMRAALLDGKRRRQLPYTQPRAEKMQKNFMSRR
jgi:hypothetical protein